jgi:hypothetical protein
VRRSRVFALNAARRLVPGSRFDLWALAQIGRLVSVAPRGVSRALAKLSSHGVRLHDAITLKEYARADGGPPACCPRRQAVTRVEP